MLRSERLIEDDGEWWWRYVHLAHYRSDWMKQDPLKDKTFRKFTLSAFTETGHAESSIVVPYQRSYTSRNPVITSLFANTRSIDLSVTKLLAMLNFTLGTSYTLDDTYLSSLLENCITKYDDFGTCYGHLRSVWFNDLTGIEDELRTREALDRHMRKDVLVGRRIVNRRVPPRRVWDLYSNRVVPWWVVRRYPLGISHAWMEKEDRVDVLTPINGREWPVPIPKDADLDLIRIEMLNLGAEYAWLDVLCLRQVGGQGEHLRPEEWKVDVPTIGYVYRWTEHVVTYFSGLGRPWILKAGDFRSDRYWFRRAWTLQEFSRRQFNGEPPIIAGDTRRNDIMEKEVLVAFWMDLESLLEVWGAPTSNMMGNLRMLSAMQKRVSTNPVDKIVALTYLLDPIQVPAYYDAQSEEDAWTALVGVIHPIHRAQLFFQCPQTGNGPKCWRPSWKQTMTEVLPLFCRSWGDSVHCTETDADWCDSGAFIESGYVRGLAEGSPEGKCRQGELAVRYSNTRGKHTFKIVADHQYPIPDGLYTLLGSNFGLSLFQGQYWVVGKIFPGQMFKKVSVFQIFDVEEIKRLQDVGVVTNARLFLS
ncbi:hypothetical protein EDD18DRAFT_1358557 [Armillaria luteobubalina]|uniref:Heterokaryon incompatibility domain-containing protein n=1 Tax=Armillaria luteobubalina TaxID=153913 RepID=A0AA39PX56_9AGAR|nr:hypothetical protein EDD18DRAFT_1358557 [Armillaria luteobubalina]